jgi:hypothetical protein
MPYWDQFRDKEFGIMCRLKHGESSWYFSFTGRFDQQQQRMRVERDLQREYEGAF